MSTVTLVPAYGRDYTSKKAVEADLKANKDFIINDISMGRYDRKPASLDSLKAAGVVTAYVRYAKLRKVCEVKL